MATSDRSPLRQVFLAFLCLGLTSFGGPVAHLGYFREEFVVRRRWLSDAAYADLVALCQFLPGPASSQVGIGIGLARAGVAGAVVAWCGFTLPSAAALVLFAYGVAALDPSVVHSGWLHGLKVAAVAIVAQAIWGMARTLCPDRTRVSLAVAAAALTLFWPGVGGQLAAIGAGAAFGWLALETAASAGAATHPIPVRRRTALLCLSLFVLLLCGLPLAAEFAATPAATLVDRFYRVGSLVFGGGHVVLPLLQGEVVGPGWIGPDLFLAGYGAAQAIPGPLVTFSAYLGAAMAFGPGGWAGGLLCLLAIFLPSFLLVIGVLPFWEQLRRMLPVRQALTGVNAAVVGLLLAAFYDPVWTRGILSPADFVLGLTAFALLAFWRLPPWLVVLLAGAGGAALGAAG